MRFLTVAFLFGLVAVSSALSNSDDLVKNVPIVKEVSEEKQVMPDEVDAAEEANDAEEPAEVGEENAASKESDDSNASNDDNASDNEAKKTVTRIYPRFVGIPLHIGIPRFNLTGHWVGRLRNSTVKAVEPEIK